MGAEIWKPVPDWPEYSVSNLGRVKRVTSSPGTRSGKILKPYKRNSGYLVVSLCRNGKKKDMYLHRVVASAFLEFKLGLDVCHYDGDKENCHVSNLRYDTRKGNIADAIRHGTWICGENSWANVHKQDTVFQVKKALSEGARIVECARKFGIPIGTVHAIKSEKIWKWLKI